MFNILLGISGSVAAKLTPKLVLELQRIGNVKLVATETAKHFTNIHECGCEIYEDKDEWEWQNIGDPILHIDLKDWADVLVVAPLSANTLAKMSVGMCDNLLTSIYRAWTFGKPIVIAPSMNTDMWASKKTSRAVNQMFWDNSKFIKFKFFSGKSIYERHLSLVYPVEKKLACGITGVGAMANIEDIVESTKNALRKPSTDCF